MPKQKFNEYNGTQSCLPDKSLNVLHMNVPLSSGAPFVIGGRTSGAWKIGCPAPRQVCFHARLVMICHHLPASCCVPIHIICDSELPVSDSCASTWDSIYAATPLTFLSIFIGKACLDTQTGLLNPEFYDRSFCHIHSRTYRIMLVHLHVFHSFIGFG